MNSLRAHLEEDHRQIDALLRRATSGPSIDREAFETMRGRLLRHIGIEEKIVLPAARAAQGGRPLEHTPTTRVEHGAIASLLVPTPDLLLAHELRALLSQHDDLEERAGGIYDACDALLVDRVDELTALAQAYPPVPTARPFDGQNTVRTMQGALESASRIRGAKDAL